VPSGWRKPDAAAQLTEQFSRPCLYRDRPRDRATENKLKGLGDSLSKEARYWTVCVRVNLNCVRLPAREKKIDAAGSELPGSAAEPRVPLGTGCDGYKLLDSGVRWDLNVLEEIQGKALVSGYKSNRLNWLRRESSSVKSGVAVSS